MANALHAMRVVLNSSAVLEHAPEVFVQDADRPVPPAEDPETLGSLQEENAGTSLDQPSDQSS